MTVQHLASAHHELSAHELVVLLGTDVRRGLSATEAAHRLERLGPNRLPPPRRQSALTRFLLQFHNPLIYVLLVAAVAALALGERVDAGVILAVVLANAVIGFVQEQKAQSALDALAALIEDTATVLRDGSTHEVPSEEVVPGDLVVLGEGERVPADLRLVEVDELSVDESALTGESVPSEKHSLELPAETLLADRGNMVWSGTLATRGRARGVVVAHGGDTELGRVHRLMATADDLATPLTRDITRFSKILTGLIVALAIAAFLLGLARGEPVAAMITAAVALAVAAIPEGLPAAVTITLAIGVTRLARRNAIVRRLPAVETLGSTDVICTDKTGTLTENRQTVRLVATVERPRGVPPAESGDDPLAREVMTVGALCNDARLGADGQPIGDPTETALLTAAAAAGLDLRALGHEHPRVATLPFASERRMMATRHRAPAGGDVVHLKGAAEAVLDRCTTVRAAGGGTAALDTDEWHGVVAGLAASGLRVLACATAEGLPEGDTISEEDELAGLSFTLLGVQAMADPPRLEAISAVAACHRAGVAVKMVTGDHADTARAIGAEVGLSRPDEEPHVVGGAELAATDDAELPALAERADVFARVSPEDKLRLVRALQSRGHVVAMTGDGVNDAPALEQADIGVAMGRGGTEVAQEAADMILTDDNFATLEAAVEEGRGVFDNLQKFIAFALPTNIGQGLVILTAILLGSTLPITPVQILWINLTTAVLLGLPLAVEVKEPGIMERPPRDVSGPLLPRRFVVRMVLVSVLLLVAAFGTFEWFLLQGVELAEARTAAVNVFLLAEVGYLVACRSFNRSLREIGWLSNRWVPAGIAATVAVQVFFTYAPVMHTLFDTAPVGWEPWAIGVVAAVVVFVAVDLVRLIEGRQAGPGAHRALTPHSGVSRDAERDRT
ncbi:MAG TPA: HAD-IC family P-type ATPase [Jiangellales bacterium]|nr:HAD-IC family P-type ATPase [Jiangellales bacterium]